MKDVKQIWLIDREHGGRVVDIVCVPESAPQESEPERGFTCSLGHWHSLEPFKTLTTPLNA